MYRLFATVVVESDFEPAGADHTSPSAVIVSLAAR